MPSYPNPSPTATAIRGSVFSSLVDRLESYRGEIYPFHVGDTWLEPLVGARMEDLDTATHPGLHRYAPPGGLPILIDALVERLRARTRTAVERRHVLVAAGATAALAAVMGAILDPDDEVLILAPYWPLIDGIVRAFRGRPLAVPTLTGVDSADELIAAVSARATPRSVALYLNSPNNPTGAVLPPAWLERLVAWATKRGLWIVADEVYEDYVYAGEHCFCRSLAPAQTFAVHSFSKAFGMAGNRCGYVVGPTEVMSELHKVATHTFYSTPTTAQHAALAVLSEAGDAWVAAARRQYDALGRLAAERLGLPAPAGGTFLFFDVSAQLDGRGLAGFLEDCADRGVFLSPGSSFGPYPNHVRLCFTAAPPAVTERGLDALAELLAIRSPSP